VPALSEDQVMLFELISSYQMYVKEAGKHYGTVKR
jgi:hypothetical protein